MGIKSPNFTQAPNELFDEWLPKLKLVELRVIMVLIRKTFGWHKIRDRISLTQLEKATGSHRSDILTATKRLIEIGLIKKDTEGVQGKEQTFYELIVEDNSNNSYQWESPTPPVGNSNIPPVGISHPPPVGISHPQKKDSSKEKKEYIHIGSHVQILQKEYEDLCNAHKKEMIDAMIVEVNDYCASKGKSYKDYAAAIRTFIRRAKPIDIPTSYSTTYQVPSLSKIENRKEWAKRKENNWSCQGGYASYDTEKYIIYSGTALPELHYYKKDDPFWENLGL
jgi:phage replication O-like protein O